VHRKAVASGRDPVGEKKAAREADTFGELSTRFIEQWAKPRKRTWKEDENNLKGLVLPTWRHRPVKEITRRDVRELLEKIATKRPVGVNRVRALLSKVFSYAIAVDVAEYNPVTGTIPAPETSRDRVLTEDELRHFWGSTAPKKNADDEEGMLPAMSARLRLALVTAQRGGEICAMRWDELDLQAGVWTIPATKAKNGLAHRVPLSALALELIEALPREDAYVFVGARGSRQHREAVQSIELEDFRPHDLRRTAASGMASIGVSRIAISKILNHVETGVTAIYDRHGYDAEKREALTRWALELRRIVDGESARVVGFPR
jgi:integrase